MASRYKNNNRFRDPNDNGTSSTGSDTAKQNYTAITYGNDKGKIGFGIIHQPADVTSSVMLLTPDAEHAFFLDGDGSRKGWTSSIGPGNFQVECGSANKEAQDSMMLNAKNGNIVIKANRGKIRIEAVDIELIAVGDGTDRGNIRFFATENISGEAKKIVMTGTSSFRIATSGVGEVVAKSILKCYGSIFKMIDDSVTKKDAKCAGKTYAKKNNIELFESNTKLEILEILASWIPPEKTEEQVEEANKGKSMLNKTALYSERNLHMDNLGALKVGYNIVSKEASEKWLTHRLVRIAPPEEVALYYGK